jgi:disulfide bond formation protein DsbB
MLNRIFTGRIGYLLGFIASFGLVAFGLYIQVKNNLEPCPLCIFQRIAFMATGVMFLLAALHHPQGLWRRVYGALQFIAAATGAGIAIRHIWIQSHADEVMAECGAGVAYLFEHFPLRKFLQLVFKGTGECSTIDWTFLGFSIPQLSLVAFTGLAIYAVVLMLARKA